MGLFKPGWMSKDENKAMRSLDRVSDDEELYRIATECPHLNVQIRAVSRIRDADRRLDVALTKRLISLNVRRAALEGASEERLCLVAGKAPMCDIRLEAVDRMSDDTFLAKLVLGGAGGKYCYHTERSFAKNTSDDSFGCIYSDRSSQRHADKYKTEQRCFGRCLVLSGRRKRGLDENRQ